MTAFTLKTKLGSFANEIDVCRMIVGNLVVALDADDREIRPRTWVDSPYEMQLVHFLTFRFYYEATVATTFTKR